MIKIYLIALNAILNSIILKIAILVNPIKKVLKIDKNIYIATIHKYVDTTYLIIGNPGIFAVLITTSAVISKPLSPI